jgi:phosphomannomutase
MQSLEARFPSAQKDRADGLKLELPEGWIHVRASNTEPLLRVAAEAKSVAEVERLYTEVLRLCADPQ